MKNTNIWCRLLCFLSMVTACDEKPTVVMDAAAPTATVTARASAAAIMPANTSTAVLGVPVPKGARVEAKVNATFYYYKDTDQAALDRSFDVGLKAAGWTIDKERVTGGYRIGEIHKGKAKAKFSSGCMESGEEHGECFISLQKIQK